MTDKKIFKVLAAIFALRASYYNDTKHYDMAVAYSDAFDMLAYAATGNWDCLRQFGWSDEAEALIEKIGTDIDFWDLETLISKRTNNEN